MVRWARSKGSAGSNERTEEEATPWSQLVAGIRQNRVAESNVEDLDDEGVFVAEDVVPSNDKVKETPKDQPVEEDEDAEETEEKVDILKEEKPKEVVLIEQDDPDDDKAKKKKKKRSQDKCLNCKQKGHLKKECPDLSEERRKELQELYTMKIERKGHGTGRKKNKRKAADAIENKGNEGHEEGEATTSSKAAEQGSPAKKAKVEKGEAKKSWKRGPPPPPKKPLVDITGQTVQEDEGLFQGFRVKKEAVKKLRSLQAQLKTEDRPETEIAETMKRERRKAERELAKFRKMVCFNCRQSGHLLVDCPQQKKEDNKTETSNHCFKCGSKEHTSRDCASKRKGKDAYQFATCFICKETGHLAKSCPDNPRGLYPKGGGCRFCGSVEHLKADCSRKIQKDEKLEVKVGVISSGNSLEDIVDDRRTNDKADEKPQKKIVKF